MDLSRLLRRVLLASTATMLISCGGGGSYTTPVITNASAVGIFAGKSAAGNNVTMLVELSNRYWIFYVSPAAATGLLFIDTGTATIVSPAFTTSSDTEYALLYTDPHASNALLPPSTSAGSVTSNLTVDMDFNTQQQISGSILSGTGCISNPGGCTVQSVITPTYVGNSTGTAALLSTIAGNYADNFSSTLNTSALQAASCDFSTALNVGSNGKVTGTLDNCSGTLPSQSTVTGTLTPRMDILAYDVTLTFTAGGGGSNPLDGITYTGIAYYYAAGKRIMIGAISADQTSALGLVASGPN